jgi:hypothetical protein
MGLVVRRNLLIALLLSLVLGLRASAPDEGIWIPVLIEKYNIKLMQEKGFFKNYNRETDKKLFVAVMTIIE